MDDRSILFARLDEIAGDIQRAADVLASDQLDDDLRQRVRIRFETDLERLRADEDKQRRFVAKAVRGVGHGVAALQTDAQEVFNECLAFVHGALFRSARLDEDACTAADALARQLGKYIDVDWGRLTIVGEDDLFVPMAGIIRLRFPSFTVWSLPVVAHEFAHYAVRRPELEEVVRTIEAEADHVPKPHEERARLEELFADVFGVYACGPAYAYTTVLLRFDASRTEDNATHPRDAKRVHAILHALEKLNRGQYHGVLQQLRKAWADRVASAAVGELDPEAQRAVTGVTGLFIRVLKSSVPLVRYAGWPQALALADSLTRAASGAKADDVRDAINAAWIARARTWKPTGAFDSRIEDAALALCTGVPQAVGS